jgi:hypothetical protein
VQSYSNSNLEEAGWGGKRLVLPYIMSTTMKQMRIWYPFAATQMAKGIFLV